MSPQLNEYLVATDCIPHRRPLADRPKPLRPRRLRMARWERRIQPQ